MTRRPIDRAWDALARGRWASVPTLAAELGVPVAQLRRDVARYHGHFDWRAVDSGGVQITRRRGEGPPVRAALRLTLCAMWDALGAGPLPRRDLAALVGRSVWTVRDMAWLYPRTIRTQRQGKGFVLCRGPLNPREGENE